MGVEVGSRRARVIESREGSFFLAFLFCALVVGLECG